MKSFSATPASLFFLLFILTNLQLKAQVIRTVAGGVGEGALPQNFVMDNPNAIIVDKKNNIYFYEDLSNQIKKIDAVTGRIKTIAGTGVLGFSGDNDSAIHAQLVNVDAMALDSAGNLYFADASTDRIRKINTKTGIITTVAGNGTVGNTKDGQPAYGKPIGSPRGLAFDKAGNMYFSESTNDLIRKVDKTTGLLSTIAGTGLTVGPLGDGGLATAALIHKPTSLILDDSNNIFFVDLDQFRVRKISATTGIINTVAGTGVYGNTGNGGLGSLAQIGYLGNLILDGNGHLLFCDPSASVIRKVHKQTGIITLFAGTNTSGFSGDGGLAVNAKLSDPLYMGMDTLGNIFFCDSYNHRIRKININGIISTIAGNGTQSFIGLGFEAIYAQKLFAISLAIDSSKNIYSINSNRICKINAQTGVLTAYAGTGIAGFSGDNGPASAAMFNYPNTMVMDKSGNIFINDYNNYRIRKINAVTQIITTIAGTGIQGFSGDGGLATAANIGGITSMDIDSAGNLYICDVSGSEGGHNRIRKIHAATGIITTFAGGSTLGFSGDGGLVADALFDYPSKVRVDLQGNVYIYDQTNNRIRKVDAQTGIIRTILGGGTSGVITEGSNALDIKYFNGTLMEIDANQNLYISRPNSAIIYQVDAKTGLISNFAGTGVEGFSGDGLAPTQANISATISNLKFDQSGNAWFVDNMRIRAISNTAPTILSQPRMVTACLNSTILFSIKASCDSAYQWQQFHGGVYTNIQNNSIFSGTQSNILSISILDSGFNNDSFRCVVYGPLGITFSNGGALRIKPEQNKPQISGPLIACQDQSAVYSVPNLVDHFYFWKITGGGFIGNTTKNSVSAFWSLNKQDTISIFDSIYGTKCGVSTSLIVALKPKPSPAFTYSQSGGKVIFYPSQAGIMLYSWVINKITSNDQNPRVQFTSNGIYNVFLKVTDSLNCYKDTSTTIQVTTVGVQDVLNPNPAFTIFPNPVKERLTIAVNQGDILYNLTITDIAGRSIQSFEGIREDNFTLNMETFQKGFYIVHLSRKGSSKSFKIVKE